MNPFVQTLKAILVLEYPHGVRLCDLHHRHFSKLKLWHIALATAELSGDGLVKRWRNRVEPTTALFEAEIARLRLKLAQETHLKTKRSINAELVTVTENLKTLSLY